MSNIFISKKCLRYEKYVNCFLDFVTVMFAAATVRNVYGQSLSKNDGVRENPGKNLGWARADIHKSLLTYSSQLGLSSLLNP